MQIPTLPRGGGKPTPFYLLMQYMALPVTIDEVREELGIVNESQISILNEDLGTLKDTSLLR